MKIKLEMPTPEEFENLYKVTGELVIQWALLEQSLDMLVAIIHPHGGNELFDQLPRGFDRKAAYLKRCFRNIPALATYNELGCGIVIRAKNLAPYRDTLVHGAISGIDRESNKVFFHRLNTDETIHRAFLERLGIKQILDTSGTCAPLSTDIHYLIASLAVAFGVGPIPLTANRQ